MRFTIVISTIILLLPGVLAGAQSSAFQSVLMWNVYRMDVILNGVGKTAIAAGCPKGSGPDGSMLFDEFMQCVQVLKKNGKGLWPGGSGVGGDLDPDVEDAADGLRGTRHPYPSAHDPGKVLPGVYKPGDVTTFEGQIGTVVDRFQELRNAVPNWNDPGNLDGPFEKQVANARKAISLAHIARIDENYAKIKIGADAKLKQFGFPDGVATKFIVMDDGTTFTAVDTDGTLEKIGMPKNYPKIRDALNSFLSDYSGSSKNAVSHANAIAAIQSYETRMAGPPDC